MGLRATAKLTAPPTVWRGSADPTRTVALAQVKMIGEVDSMRGGAEEARLRGELARLRPLNPFEVLGVPPNATGEAIRAAFLAATKRFHPNLFGRDSAEVQELATEVFLVVRRAYALLSDEDKRRALRERLAGGPGPNRFAPAAPLSSTPPLGMPSAPPPPSPSSAPQRPLPPPKAKTPPTQPPSGPMPRTTPPTQPPSGPAPTRVAAPTPRPVKPVTPSPSPSPPAAPPGRSRVGSTTDVQAILDAAKGRGGRFEQSNRLIAEGKFREAREMLQKIAAEDPQNRKYRVRLGLAWGLEYRAARRYDEAVRELERALGLDPDNAELADVLRKTREQREANSGLISKLFGR